MANILSMLPFIGQMFGSFQQNSNIRDQITAQQEENKRNREYNLMLARMQNQWNIEQWNRENAYNSPSAIMGRLKSAGLNPDLAISGGNLSALKGGSAAPMTSGAASEPVDMSNLANRRVIGDSLQQAATAAQIDLIKSEAEKNRAQTHGQEKTNYWMDALNRSTIDLQTSTITLNGAQTVLSQSQKNLIDENIIKVREEVSNLSVLREQLRANIGNLNADTALKKIDATLRGPLVRANINQLAASARLSNEEANKLIMFKTLEYSGLALSNAQKQQAIRIAEKAGLKVDAETDILHIEADHRNTVLNSEIVKNFASAFATVVNVIAQGAQIQGARAAAAMIK